MSFWMLSFLEKFEKEFESSQKRIAQGLLLFLNFGPHKNYGSPNNINPDEVSRQT